MSQTFQALRCSQCSTFQVHQVKKSIKWICKMCGEKQSIIHHYGTGTGKECRLHVQKLNSMRGDFEQSIKEEPLNCEEILASDTSREIPTSMQTGSKWSKFMEKNTVDVIVAPQVPDSLLGVEVTLEIPKEKKRKLNVLEPKRLSTKTVRDIPKTRHRFENTPNKENKPTRDPETSPSTLVDFENCFESYESTIPAIASRMPNQIDTQIQDKQELPKCSKYEAVKVSKHSKWAQFVEKETCDEHLDPENISPQMCNLSQTIFYQSNDEDLDALLDI